MGGLGNQMFQYAMGRRLAIERNVPMGLDLSWFDTQHKRKFELDKLKIKAETAEPNLVNHLKNLSNNRVVKKAYHWYQACLPTKFKRKFLERDPGNFDKRVFDVSGHCYLDGYWQSEKYFLPIEEILREEFQLKQTPPENVEKLASIMNNNPNSISVHVRRGDYVSENTGHRVCDANYYQRACSHIVDNIDSPHFFFFSDNIDWVKNNFKLDLPSSYIDSTISDVHDLFLISACHHHINANSSFCWWGAWLGERDENIIIVPNKWYTHAPYPEDRIPERWVRL